MALLAAPSRLTAAMPREKPPPRRETGTSDPSPNAAPPPQLGEELLYRHDTEPTGRRVVDQLGRLGHKATLEPMPEAT